MMLSCILDLAKDFAFSSIDNIVLFLVRLQAYLFSEYLQLLAHQMTLLIQLDVFVCNCVFQKLLSILATLLVF